MKGNRHMLEWEKNWIGRKSVIYLSFLVVPSNSETGGRVTNCYAPDKLPKKKSRRSFRKRVSLYGSGVIGRCSPARVKSYGPGGSAPLLTSRPLRIAASSFGLRRAHEPRRESIYSQFTSY